RAEKKRDDHKPNDFHRARIVGRFCETPTPNWPASRRDALQDWIQSDLISAAVSCRRLPMQIYVGKNGQQLGPFSLEEVNRKLADGTFVGTDLAWYEGAAGWAPLSGVAGVVIPAAASATAAPAPAPTSAPMQPAPVVAPVRPNASIVQPAPRGTGTLSMV